MTQVTTPEIIHRPMAIGLNGYFDKATNTIHINTLYDRATQRSTEAHELQHAERGDTACCDPWFDAKQEVTVERAASMRLISAEDLAKAVTESHHVDHIAALLEVDVDMLHVRIELLTTDEWEAISNVVQRRDRAA